MKEEKQRGYLTESLAAKEETDNEGKNWIALILKITGILIIITGFILGPYLASIIYNIFIKLNLQIVNTFDKLLLKWLITTMCWGVALTNGLVFIGFGENLRLLHKINNKN